MINKLGVNRIGRCNDIVGCLCNKIVRTNAKTFNFIVNDYKLRYHFMNLCNQF